MRVQVVSDVHVEFHRDGGQSFVESLDPDGVDVLIIAGDLGTLSTVTRALRAFCLRFPHVVFVAGNHEYYGTNWLTLEGALEVFAGEVENFHWLHDSAVEIEGQRFVGGTMWFARNERSHWYKRNMNDFFTIGGFDPEVYRRNQRAVDFLEATVTSTDIVVTHHLPSFRSVPVRYANSPLNGFFVHDMTPLIERTQPRMWVHGHTHDSCDYQLGATRVLCNPFGYVGESLNRQFNDNLVVEV